jgi:hypothetical protein
VQRGADVAQHEHFSRGSAHPHGDDEAASGREGHAHDERAGRLARQQRLRRGAADGEARDGRGRCRVPEAAHAAQQRKRRARNRLERRKLARTDAL